MYPQQQSLSLMSFPFPVMYVLQSIPEFLANYMHPIW